MELISFFFLWASLFQDGGESAVAAGVCEILREPQRFLGRLVKVRASHRCSTHQCVLSGPPGCDLYDQDLRHAWPAILPVELDERSLPGTYQRHFPRTAQDLDRARVLQAAMESLEKTGAVSVSEIEAIGEVIAPLRYRRVAGATGDPVGVGHLGEAKALFLVKRIEAVRIDLTLRPPR